MRLCARGYLVLQSLERPTPNGFDLKNVRASTTPQGESCIRKFRGQQVVVIPVPCRWLKSEEQLKQVLNKTRKLSRPYNRSAGVRQQLIAVRRRQNKYQRRTAQR